MIIAVARDIAVLAVRSIFNDCVGRFVAVVNILRNEEVDRGGFRLRGRGNRCRGGIGAAKRNARVGVGEREVDGVVLRLGAAVVLVRPDLLHPDVLCLERVGDGDLVVLRGKVRVVCRIRRGVTV